MPAFEEITMSIGIAWWLIVSVFIVGMLVSLIIFALSSREETKMRRYL